MKRVWGRFIMLVIGVVTAVSMLMSPASAIPPYSNDQLCVWFYIGPGTPVPGGPTIPYTPVYQCVPAP